MANTSPVILILGSGPNVGHHVARAFAGKGYKVALASRSLKEEDSNKDRVCISADLSDPQSVKDIFSKVKASLGLPSVVVYNGKHVPHGNHLLKNLLTSWKLLRRLQTIQPTLCLFHWLTSIETFRSTRPVRLSLHNRRL